MPPPRVDVAFEVDPTWDLRVRAGAAAALERAASGLRCSVAERALEVPADASATLVERCAAGLAELGVDVDVDGIDLSGGLDPRAFVGAWKGSVRSVRRAPGGEAAAKLEIRFAWDPAAAVQAVAEAEKRADEPSVEGARESVAGVGGGPVGGAEAGGDAAGDGAEGDASTARAVASGISSAAAPSELRAKRGRRDELLDADESLVPLTRAQLLSVARDPAIRRALRGPSIRAHVRAVDASPPEAREAALQAYAAADPAFQAFTDAVLERVLPAPIDSRDVWGEKKASAAPLDPEARAEAILRRELERVARENEER